MNHLDEFYRQKVHNQMILFLTCDREADRRYRAWIKRSDRYTREMI